MRTKLISIVIVLLAGCSSLEKVMSEGKHTSILHPGQMVGFLVTRDAARCRAFFVDRLGFRAVGEDQWALVLDADGRMIRVQKGTNYEPRPYTVLGWNVADIESTVTRLEAAGVRCEHFGFPGQDARGIMTFPDGARVGWFKDPDGNVLSVAQLP